MPAPRPSSLDGTFYHNVPPTALASTRPLLQDHLIDLTAYTPEDVPLRDLHEIKESALKERISGEASQNLHNEGTRGRGNLAGEVSHRQDSQSGESYMNRRNRSRATEPSSPTPEEDHQNGNGNGIMNTTPLEHRRKYSVVDGSSASQVAHLMSRDGFSLNEAPQHPIPTEDSGAANGFWELPEKDRKNFLLLVLLYFLQGIPMGLAGGSVPFLLKSHLSYGQIGVFSLASYPYSLKLLWSPIVDAVWSRRIGRRKSWILPVQMFSGFGMIWLGSRVEQMMVDTGANDGAGIWSFTWWWFFLVFTCATQDIAVDGSYLPSSLLGNMIYITSNNIL